MDSRTFGLTFKEVLIVDSTTIRLFSDILKGVGRNPEGDVRKKRGMKKNAVYRVIEVKRENYREKSRAKV
ncbi:MAG: hypothetical protein KBG40_01215 [Bacteroidales bacterium]|nr:hypothetical protein [Bacteroidales bacterium]